MFIFLMTPNIIRLIEISSTEVSITEFYPLNKNFNCKFCILDQIEQNLLWKILEIFTQNSFEITIASI